MNYKAIIKRQSTIIAVAVICLTLTTIGVSYALFFQVETNSNNQVVQAGSLDVAYGSGTASISATEFEPLSDEDALLTSSITGTIYIENKGTLPAYYTVKLGNDIESFNNRSDKLENDKLISYEHLKVAAYLDGSLVLEPVLLSDLESSSDNEDMKILFKDIINTTGTGENTATIVLKVWVTEDAPESIIGDHIYLKMDVTSEVDEIVAEGSSYDLKNKIIKHATDNNYLNTSTPNFSEPSKDGEQGLYKTVDDTGISYYFRGDATNNYVQFGSYAAGSTVNGTTYAEETPMYWRIIRINGDGTIRLVYDGTTKVENGTIHNSNVGYSAFNSNYDNAKYVGYTYEGTNEAGETVQVDSTIKGVLDTWYDTHIEANYGGYIADSIFCNDRSEASYTYLDENYEEITVPNAAVYTNIYYGAYKRLSTDKAPSLKCTNQSDRYTLDDTTNGNGLLSNPVGLITADEEVLAGNSAGKTNTSYYLYNRDSYWTSAPSYWSGTGDGRAAVWFVLGGSLDDFSVYSENGVRPVISLKADVEFTGDGSIDNPYKIKELSN